MIFYLSFSLLFFIFLPMNAFYTSNDLAFIQAQKTKPTLTFFEKAHIKNAKKVPSYHDAFWWQLIPSTGLYFNTSPDALFLPHQFTLWQLAPHLAKGVPVALFDTEVETKHPLLKCCNTFYTFGNVSTQATHLPFYDHGTHIAGLIGARLAKTGTGISGIAPEATLFSFNVLHSSGKPASLTSLIQAVEKAIEHKCMVANISFTFDEYDDPHNPQRKKLEKLLQYIPYVICASGNKGKQQKEIFQKRISYPARIKNHVISVGSFGCTYNQTLQKYEYSVSPFSQYEPGVGPHFLAPGQSILGCSCVPKSSSIKMPHQTDLYAFHSGTSCSAAILSGFFALVVGEFGSTFLRDQVLYVCQISGCSLNNNTEWKEKSLYGVLDFRTALFILHVLKSLENKIIFKKISFMKFKHMTDEIRATLFLLPKCKKSFDVFEAITFIKMKLLEP